VDKLEEKKLVTRTVCPANRRAVDICITEAGLSLLGQIDDSGLTDVRQNGMNALSDSEASQLNELLDKIRA
jgi:DNA-binding MarR family transcriptional regulator